MSAGIFTSSKYEASYATAIHPIRVQPETISAAVGAVTNAAPAGALTNPISAITSSTKRQLGLHPRYVYLRAPETGQPTGYKPGGITKIPALTEAFWNLCIKGTSVSYLGATFSVVSRVAEEAR